MVWAAPAGMQCGKAKSCKVSWLKLLSLCNLRDNMMPSIFTKVKEGTAPKLFWIVVVEHVESSWREREAAHLESTLRDNMLRGWHLERERERERGTHSYVRTDGPHGLQSLWLRLEKLLLWHHPRTGIVFFKECTQELGLLV